MSYRFPATGTCVDCEPSIPTFVREKDTFYNVSSIKPHPDSHFCILTLKESIEQFSESVQPLCLPEINGEQKDDIRGTVLGFGYKKDFPDYVKRLVKEKKLKERQMVRHDMNVISSAKCVNRFTLPYWAFQRKTTVVGTGSSNREFFWIERYRYQKIQMLLSDILMF